MSTFSAIIIGMFALDLVWAITAVRLARRAAGRRMWLALNLVFVAAQLAGLSAIVVGRLMRTNWDRGLPGWAISAILLWHLLGLGLLLLVAPLALLWALGRRFVVGGSKSPPVLEPGSISRRKFLGMAALAAPPVFTVMLSNIAQAQLKHFRVRRFVLPIDRLPPDLDGITIAHVSDMHLGRLTTERVLRQMVRTVNDLKADLVLLTGDLINNDLADLPEGLALASAMHGRYGHCLIEGNHDLIESRSVFEARARASAVPFLVNQSQSLSLRGFPVQILGLRWDNSDAENRDRVISRSVRALAAQRQPDAFPILLAHHPHAFDAAAEMGIPLTLAGHTHGGQLMLTDNFGVGPMLYRYWSGHYQRAHSQLIVSNGVGNWFPLRIDAPAEIVHITLRRVL